MGRLDDIVARNKHANRGGGGGLIGAAIRASQDPTDTAEDKQRKAMAWMIVGGVCVAVVVMIALLV